MGRARGLMETCDPGYRVNRCRKGHDKCPRSLLRPGGLPASGVVNLAPGPATLPISVIKMWWWIILCIFLVFSFIGIVVLGDLLRYRDLQRRLRAERKDKCGSG